MLDFIELTDGYKLGHRQQYPDGTERVYSNFTPRASRVADQTKVVFFGLQYFLKTYLMDLAHATFFAMPRQDVVDQYQRLVDEYLGPNNIGTEHIEDLHRFGRIPLAFYALPEGTHVPLRMPMFTYENTHPDFYWVTNYIETLLSAVMWLPCTSATTAYRYRKALDDYAREHGGNPDLVTWCGHDFSFRGMGSPQAAALSGAAHLLSFTGTDTIPAIRLLKEHYYANGLIAGSVPATEHAVMCAGGQEDEQQTFARLLQLYPTGILSVVSDTWDLWDVIGTILPALKEQILARDGKLVIRPDSGIPEDILCGDPQSSNEYARKGVIECLWDLFGGSTDSRGVRTLDPHIGAIYGDSITENRAHTICRRLVEKRFSPTSVVLGIGSFTYQYVTRDTYGFAVKATWAQVNGQERMLFKDPATDNGTKRSARGRIAIVRDDEGGLRMIDGLTLAEHQELAGRDLLASVWRDGEFEYVHTLAEIRARVAKG